MLELIYGIGALITFIIVTIMQRYEPEDDAVFTAIVCAIVWPAILVALVIMTTGKVIFKIAEVFHRLIRGMLK